MEQQEINNSTSTYIANGGVVSLPSLSKFEIIIKIDLTWLYKLLRWDKRKARQNLKP